MNAKRFLQAAICGFFFLFALHGLHAQVKYKFTTTGLGLGTDSPSSLLHLKKDGSSIVFDYDLPQIRLGTAAGYTNRFLQILNSTGNGSAGGVKTGGLLVSGDYSFADPTAGQLIVQGNIGVGTGSPVFGLDMLNTSLRVNATAANDATPNLAGISLSGRGVGGTEHSWTMQTAAVGGGWGVNPNAFEIWEYPGDNSNNCCFPRFKILSDGTTILAPSGGVVGIGMVNTSYMLAVAGNGYFSGTLNVAGTSYSSDRRIKNNIQTLSPSLVLGLERLRGVSYLLNSDFIKDNRQLSGLQFGLIAQEVREVFPELVSEDEKGMLSVNYIGLVPLLLESAKAQQEEIEKLNNENEVMKAEIEKLKAEKAKTAALEERMAALEKMLGNENEEAKK